MIPYGPFIHSKHRFGTGIQSVILSEILLLCDEPFLVLYGFSKTTSLHNSKSFCYVESLLNKLLPVTSEAASRSGS